MWHVMFRYMMLCYRLCYFPCINTRLYCMQSSITALLGEPLASGDEYEGSHCPVVCCHRVRWRVWGFSLSCPLLPSFPVTGMRVLTVLSCVAILSGDEYEGSHCPVVCCHRVRWRVWGFLLSCRVLPLCPVTSIEDSHCPVVCCHRVRWRVWPFSLPCRVLPSHPVTSIRLVTALSFVAIASGDEYKGSHCPVVCCHRIRWLVWGFSLSCRVLSFH